jgi:hypothetical protein
MSAILKTGFTGDKELIARLRRFSLESKKQFRAGLVEVGKEKLEITKQIVPYKTGALQGTGRISVRVGEKQTTLKILYGGPDAPYALRVHEDLNAKHNNGRRAKFVESVVLQTRLGEELADKFDLAAAAR